MCSSGIFITTINLQFQVHAKSQGKGINNRASRHLHSPYLTKLKYPIAETLRTKRKICLCCHYSRTYKKEKLQNVKHQLGCWCCEKDSIYFLKKLHKMITQQGKRISQPVKHTMEMFKIWQSPLHFIVIFWIALLQIPLTFIAWITRTW